MKITKLQEILGETRYICNNSITLDEGRACVYNKYFPYCWKLSFIGGHTRWGNSHGKTITENRRLNHD